MKLRRSPRRNTSATSKSPYNSASSNNSSSNKRPKRKRKTTEKFENLLLEVAERKNKRSKQHDQAPINENSKKKTPTTSQKVKQTRKRNKKQNKNKPSSNNYDFDVKNILLHHQKCNGDDNISTSSSLDEKDVICCICNCGVDFSEKRVFLDKNLPLKVCHSDNTHGQMNGSDAGQSQNDDSDDDDDDDSSMNQKGKEESNDTVDTNNSDDESTIPFCGMKLPRELYDSNNALIICDAPGCNRSYHQRCHFVPVFCLPRGNWYCLICQFKEKIIKQTTTSTKKRKKKLIAEGTDEDFALAKPLSVAEVDSLFPIPHNAQGLDKREGNNDDEDTIQIVTVQKRFEYQSASLKVKILNTELKRIKSTIDSALGNVRLEEHTIRGFTETERAKKSLKEHFKRSKRLPQQLVQSIHRMAYSKVRVRELMHSIDSTIRNKNDRQILWNWYTNEKESAASNNSQSNDQKVDWDLLKSKLFSGNAKRIEPRFEIKDYDGDIEDESDDDDDPTKKIICSVCFNGEVHQENDVIMCDGENCFRAFHMKCCNPVVTQKMLDDDEQGTWFCPYCYALANAIHYTQTQYYGDEVDEEEEGKQDERSSNSWDEAEDVFPESVVELSSADLWKHGKGDEKSDEYLSSFLGIQVPERGGNNDDGSESDSDEESDHNYSMADEEDNRSDSDSSSSVSSENGVDLKWEIDQNEVEALSTCSASDDSVDKQDAKSDRRRRIRSNTRSNANREKTRDIGTLDTNNIIFSKRNRTKVDYNR